jgi:hypothetical protein
MNFAEQIADAQNQGQLAKTYLSKAAQDARAAAEAKAKPEEDSTGIPLPGSGLAKTLGLSALGVTTLGSLAGGRALGHGAQHALCAAGVSEGQDCRARLERPLSEAG